MPSRDPAAVLKSTPPRIVRGFLDRTRLHLTRLELNSAGTTALLAPTGFGKTTQLAHWRHEALARGAVALWHSVDARDEPMRFARGLAYCAQISCGKRGFSELTLRWIEQCPDPHEALTGWLAEIAELAFEVLLLLDDVDQLPTLTRTQVLPYLLGNTPPNLHIALSARPTSALMASGTLSTAPVVRVTAADLRFRLDETLTVLATALGGRCNPEAGVRLHELTEGWPLGVQLAIAALRRGGDVEDLLSVATADIRRYFIETLIERQPARAVHLLVRLANFDLIHPSLCSAVLEQEALTQELRRLQDETPLFMGTEDTDWIRLHPVARAALTERWSQLPESERRRLCRRASDWYRANELPEEAAQQSFLSGDIATAITLVEGNTHRMLISGRSTAVLDWYRRLSSAEIRHHPGFWAPAAWALAMERRSEEAKTLLELILTQPDVSLTKQFEAMLIEATSAGFADRVDRVAALLEAWPEPPAHADAGAAVIYWIARGFDALHRGHPDQARLHWARIAGLDQTQAYSPVSYGMADYGLGVSHLWEGRYALAEQVLRPALARAEERISRQHPIACMLAAALATACWEGGQNDEPQTLLVGRLDVLETNAPPDAPIIAYQTLARIADHEGRQDQALNLLDSLGALGQNLSLPRLRVAAQFELVRLHARRGRSDAACSLSGELDTLVNMARTHTPGMFIPWLEVRAHLARAYAELASDEEGHLGRALQAAQSAAATAAGLKLGVENVEAQLLRAQALMRQSSREAVNALNEALSLAQANGMLRLVREYSDQRGVAHGAVRDMLIPPKQMSAEPRKGTLSEAISSKARGRGLLTLKERGVLTLLNRNLSNKEIAIAMSVSEQTVKWHMKNLFHKLQAASRKHAIARARALGLVDGG